MENLHHAANTAPSEDKPEQTPGIISAGQDHLTGLYSQNAFNHRLKQIIKDSAHNDSPYTLALLQLANFYEIRAWVGKLESNLLLNDIARLLEDTVPENSVSCRCHNHEFAVILAGEGSRRAMMIADHIKQALHTCSSQFIPPQLSLRCNVGLVSVNHFTPDIEVAFARARHNMSSQQTEQATDHAYSGFTAQQPPDLLNKLHHAMASNSFKLNFQATVDFKEGGLKFYEIRSALAEKDTLIPAAVFLETVVKNAMGEGLDRWVIKQAIKLLLENPDGNYQLMVNLSQNSLVSASFLDWLKSNPDNCNRVSRQLIVQVSELDILIAQHHMDKFCRTIDALGIRLCISHFGCTQNPLRYLSLLNAHYVKLDPSLTGLSGIDSDRHQHLQELIKNIHNKDMQVIAALIEHTEELPILWKAGVDFVQGYGLHKPEPIREYSFITNQELSVP